MTVSYHMHTFVGPFLLVGPMMFGLVQTLRTLLHIQTVWSQCMCILWVVVLAFLAGYDATSGLVGWWVWHFLLHMMQLQGLWGGGEAARVCGSFSSVGQCMGGHHCNTTLYLQEQLTSADEELGLVFIFFPFCHCFNTWKLLQRGSCCFSRFWTVTHIGASDCNIF